MHFNRNIHILTHALVHTYICSDGPARCLDLGCGIGSVLMMVAWQFPNATCLGVEAQTLSASMARRSLQYNGADDRVKVILKDLRELDVSLFNVDRHLRSTVTPTCWLVCRLVS